MSLAALKDNNKALFDGLVCAPTRKCTLTGFIRKTLYRQGDAPV